MSRRRWLPAGVLAVAVLAIPSCTGADPPPGAGGERRVEGGDAARGARVISVAGCATCHTIPGIDDADADVGPPLTGWSRREFIAGRLTHTEQNLVTWLLDPQSVDPMTAMPDVGLTEQEARDVAAYLESLE